MANLRKIRTRIKSVKSTQQITKSMKMVAASKLRRTQAAFGDLRTFADKSGEILARVSAGAEDNPYLTTHAENRRVCYVLIVGNRGLCGTYNTALLRYLEELAAKEERESFLVVAGRWGKDMIQTLGLPVRRSFEISDTPDSAEARELSAYLRELYRDGEADEIVLVYEQFRSVLSQSPGSRTLLPLQREESAAAGGDVIFEPDRKALLDTLVDMYLDNSVHAALLEARTGEHSSRMTAMTSASDNTEELIAELTLQLNHARQSAITTEISEIVGGAEALKN
ncbi:MAG: ATP synthase F1 subunit gamma [Eubacteriales bacterium]|nr:ATP synthase F1 subunit gamma [Eubacteriales bacterium]